jgi:hypothetical protein
VSKFRSRSDHHHPDDWWRRCRQVRERVRFEGDSVGRKVPGSSKEQEQSADDHDDGGDGDERGVRLQSPVKVRGKANEAEAARCKNSSLSEGGKWASECDGKKVPGEREREREQVICGDDSPGLQVRRRRRRR